MRITMKWKQYGALLCVATSLSHALPTRAQSKFADAQLTTNVQRSLENERFSGVRVAVRDGIVNLSGSVDLYATKEDAEHKVHHKAGVLAVHNAIEVRSADVSDVQLRTRLAEKLAYDRVGYGTTAFNSYTLGVQDGIVTIGGVAYSPTDKDSALSLVSHFPGVKDVVDEVETAPLSPSDDRIRVEAARAIYGFPSLQRYAIDPAKPIRITVVNGDIILSGVVDRRVDREAADIRARTVPGVFKVTNNLQIADTGKSETR